MGPVRLVPAPPAATGFFMESSHVKILLLEDSETDARLVIDTLHRAAELQAETLHVTTLAEAREHLGECELLIADLHVPDGDYAEVLHFCGQVRQSRPVVIITSMYGATPAYAAGRRGLGFLRKPTTPEGLIVEIRRSQGILDAIREHDCRCQRAIELLDRADVKAEEESQLARSR